MPTLACPHCSAETPADYNFCVNCDKQVKCLNPDCKSVLVAGKTFCFTCGQPLPSIPTQLSHPNRYFREVTQKGEDFSETTEWNVSDHAVSELAPFIVEGMTLRAQQRTIYQGRRNGPSGQTDRQSEQGAIQGTDHLQLPPKDDDAGGNGTNDQEQQRESAEGKDKQEQRSGKEGAARYFTRDGDYLIALKKDFKGKSWKEQQKNFVLLYASAYPHLFNKPVPTREHIIAAAQKASVYDTNNFSTYLNQLTRKELTEISTGYIINDDGEKEVKKIIGLMEAENSNAGYPYWDRSAAPTSSSNNQRLSREDKDKIAEWVKDPVKLGKLEIRSIHSPTKYALLGLWILTVHLKKAQAVRWNEAFYYLKDKYTTIATSADAFRTALGRGYNSKYFKHSDDKHYLTPQGQKIVEGWIAGKPVNDPDEEKETGSE